MSPTLAVSPFAQDQLRAPPLLARSTTAVVSYLENQLTVLRTRTMGVGQGCVCEEQHSVECNNGEITSKGEIDVILAHMNSWLVHSVQLGLPSFTLQLL